MNELAVTNQNHELGIFRDASGQMDAVEKMGAWIAKSGLVACKSVEQGYLVAFTCLAMAITPIEFAQTYDIIEGKLAMKSGAMLARFRTKYGGKYKWVNTGDDCKCATIRLTYLGETEEVSFGIEAANRAGLSDKAMWKKYTPEMLRGRAITKGLRIVCPEIAAGVYSPEEIADMDGPEKVEVVTLPTNDALDNSELERLERLLEPHENTVNAIAVAQGWVSTGATFRDIPAERARRILATPAPLLEKLRSIEAEQSADDARQLDEAEKAAGGEA